jgi:phosphoribosylglycinamide formyltransferase-1
MIGDEIEVRIVDIRGDKVRLGVDAPRNVSVHRREIYDQIKLANQQAAQIAPTDVPQIRPTAPVLAPIRIAVLISGGGTTLKNLLSVITAGKLNARVDRVIASRPGIGGIALAESAGLRVDVIDRKAFSSGSDFSQAVFNAIGGEVELVSLAGWLSLLEIPREFAGKVMNIHPALLPAFGGKGMFGKHVHSAVIGSGCKVSGCTVHFVDATYDTGPIILQRTCEVRDDDTPQSLAARVFELEKQAYPEAIRMFHAGKLRVENGRVIRGAS